MPPETPLDTPASAGIHPDDLATTLRVLAQLHELDREHPDFVSVRRATGHMFKAVKQARRRELRDAVLEADRAVVAATATGAPDRIDDETRGRELTSSVTGAATAGTLQRAQACYICKQPYTEVDWFYHQLCPSCAAFSHAKRMREPTSPASARCSPAAGPRSGCTSPSACCATGRT